MFCLFSSSQRLRCVFSKHFSRFSFRCRRFRRETVCSKKVARHSSEIKDVDFKGVHCVLLKEDSPQVVLLKGPMSR